MNKLAYTKILNRSNLVLLIENKISLLLSAKHNYVNGFMQALPHFTHLSKIINTFFL